MECFVLQCWPMLAIVGASLAAQGLTLPSEQGVQVQSLTGG